VHPTAGTSVQLIYEGVFVRTLDHLVQRFAGARGSNLEAWTFDDERSRRAAEAKLAAYGVRARFRSAYKPLLHFFMEEVDLSGLAAVHVIYPVHAAAPENRFRLETYPLAALLGGAKLTFEAATKQNLVYEVKLTREDGQTSSHSVFAPNRVHADFAGETLVSPTGWLRIDGDLRGKRFETDYEALFAAVIDAVASYGWGDSEPYFEELNIAVTLPIEDRRLPVGEEAISPREAMHEDLYFSLLEVFQKRSGRASGDRGLRPGQIVPEVHYAEADPAVRIEKRPLARSEMDAASVPLNSAASPISAGQVRAELAGIGGEAFAARAWSGRAVEARYRRGADRAVMISAGQHANETTGIVGSLRAARVLAGRAGAHFVISPLENPDGYQLHWRLSAANPRHMHHAARYTALGDDLEYRSEPLFEKAIRHEGERLSKAKLHLNLHGYPSHEWTRPLSGYVPRQFEMWTLPKGFFLIMRHHAPWAQVAERLVDRVTARLARLPGLLAFNGSQISLSNTHSGSSHFRIINGIPCVVTTDDRHQAPLTFISEYPDETIHGPAFIAGHAAQMEFVLAAYEAYQELDLKPAMIA